MEIRVEAGMTFGVKVTWRSTSNIHDNGRIVVRIKRREALSVSDYRIG